MTGTEKQKPEKKVQQEHRVGILGWKPAWLQFFNNMTTFVVLYVTLCLIYGMSNSYISSMIPSIEKRFGFSSQKIGIIIAMNDVSHVLIALLTAHFGGAGHRPRWIMYGCITLGVALLLHAAPEILFPWTKPSIYATSTSAGSSANLCKSPETSISVALLRNRSSPANLSRMSAEECMLDKNDIIGPTAVLVVAQLLLGVGATTLMILGLPFIDDNVDSKNTPLYFAISFSGRIFGPVLGYGLGAFCNTLYFQGGNPGIKQTDPRWISAWYLGFLCTGMGLCVFAMFMGCFPAAIPTKKRKDFDEKNKAKQIEAVGTQEITWHDLPRNVKRLLTNGAFMCRTGATLMDGLFISGFISFVPKFIGQQFQISGSASAIAGGIPAVLAVACGTVLGGVIIRRFKLSPRIMSMMLIGGAITISSAMFSVIALGCDKPIIRGLLDKPINGSMVVDTSCSSSHSCGCTNAEFDPVCHVESGTTFFSPCQAGCGQPSPRTSGTEKSFEKCVCLPRNRTGTLQNISRIDDISANRTRVIAGLCPKKCTNLYYYVLLLTVSFLLSGIPISGGIMLQYRIVDVDLKSMSSGLSAVIMAGLGFLPAPIIVGGLVDSTCRLWRTEECGRKGSCLLYDTDDLRWKLHLAAGGVKLVKILFDIVVTYKVWNMPYDREEEPNLMVAVASEMPSPAHLPDGATLFVTHKSRPNSPISFQNVELNVADSKVHLA